MEYASKGVAGSGLGLGIAGTALGLLNNGGLGILNGMGGNCNCSENMMVNRYELAQEQKIAELQTQVALRDANTYVDGKLLEMYKYVDGRLAGVEAQICQQSVVNAQITANLACQQNAINALQGLTKLVVPLDNICPQPTTTTTGA
jgi:hypothetical protein